MGSGIAQVIEQVLGKGFQNLGGALDVVGLDKPKKKSTSRDKLIGQTDVRKTKKRDISKKSARAALVAGSPQGILSSTTTTGRGTLLEN